MPFSLRYESGLETTWFPEAGAEASWCVLIVRSWKTDMVFRAEKETTLLLHGNRGA